MKMTRILLALFATLLLFSQMNLEAYADSDEDFGISFAPSVDKTFIPGLNLALEGEVRSKDMSSQIERLAIGAYLSYKPIPYFRAEIGYTFIDQYKQIALHGEDHPFVVAKYWAPKHEAEISISGHLPIGFLELSIRERYEITWHHDVTTFASADLYQSLPIHITFDHPEHVLRSRFQISAKIPNSGFAPYGSIDFYNNLADSGKLFNFRLLLGTDYTITSSHKVGAYLRADLFHNTPSNYLLGFKYKYTF